MKGTPLEIAIRRNHLRVVQLIPSHPENMFRSAPGHLPILQIAAKAANLAIADYLLTHTKLSPN